MVYKYWDSITKEDLEFSVGSKAAVWEVKDPLLGPNGDYEDDNQSNYPHGTAPSLVGGMNGQQMYAQRGYAGSNTGGRGYPPY